MIRAGMIEEINRDSGAWIIIDIGFSNKNATCGLCFMNDLGEKYVVLQFGEALRKVIEFIGKQNNNHVNLMIEAPLSAAFDSKGNPTSRVMEKQGGQTRCWYSGPGSTTFIAALYLLRAINKTCAHKDIRLFEGFVSFKSQAGKTGKSKKSRESHYDDVKKMWQAVKKYTQQTAVRSNINKDISRLECILPDITGIPPAIFVLDDKATIYFAGADNPGDK